MNNEIGVTITSDEDVSNSLVRIADQSRDTSRIIVTTMGDSEDAFDTAARATGTLGARLDMLDGAVSQLSGGIGDIGGAMTAFTDLTKQNAERQIRLKQAAQDVEQALADEEQAALDVKQAMNDMDQATRDAAQSGIDMEGAVIDEKEALLDVAEATAEYNKAVKEHGKNSMEAQRAANALARANLSVTQAQEDYKQAQLEGTQATQDYSQAEHDRTEATLAGKQAQLDLNAAQHDARPPTNIEIWGQRMESAATIAMGLAGAVQLLQFANVAAAASFVKSAAAATAARVATLAGAVATGIATAAQWAWNIAMSANPLGLVIIAVVALIAAIVWIATKTTWFQDLWNWTWGKIREPVLATANWIVEKVTWLWDKVVSGANWVRDTVVGAFSWIADRVSAYIDFISGMANRIANAFRGAAEGIASIFRWAFNMIAWAWNNTAGRLRFTLPEWVPNYGGASFAMPRLPMLQHGGKVLQTGAALVHKGEVVGPASTMPLDAGSSGADFTFKVEPGSDDKLMRVLLSMLSVRVQRAGGDINRLLRVKAV